MCDSRYSLNVDRSVNRGASVMIIQRGMCMASGPRHHPRAREWSGRIINIKCPLVQQTTKQI